MDVREFIVEAAFHQERLDKTLAQLNPDVSRSYLQQLIMTGFVLVNDAEPKANFKVKTGDVIELELPEDVEVDVKPVPMDLDILYEDQDLLVINKPKGLVVHPGSGTHEPTLEHG